MCGGCYIFDILGELQLSTNAATTIMVNPNIEQVDKLRNRYNYLNGVLYQQIWNLLQVLLILTCFTVLNAWLETQKEIFFQIPRE